jgi:hypothetical protein
VATTASSAIGEAHVRGRGKILVHAGLLLAAFVLLWLAQRRYASWLQESRANFQMDAVGWFTWLLAVMGAGFCFALAAYLPSGRLRVRPLLALALAAVPALGILHFAAVYLWGWVPPDFLRGSFFYLDVGPQAVLAAFVGIGLAAGIRPSDDASTPPESP